MTNRFILIVTGYNCERWAQRCIDSINAQTCRNFIAVYIDDGSTDGTRRILEGEERKNDKHIFAYYKENRGAAFRRYEWMPAGRQNSIIVLVGLDDWLMPNCLERINEEYEKGVWMTYGNWQDQQQHTVFTLSEGFQLEYPDEVHARRSYREEVYRSTAPNTFRRFLYDHIPQERFIYNGEWIKATTESPLMFACLEMCGKDRIGVINEPIYGYQRGRKDRAKMRFGKEYQNEIYKWVISQPKFDLLP